MSQTTAEKLDRRAFLLRAVVVSGQVTLASSAMYAASLILPTSGLPTLVAGAKEYCWFGSVTGTLYDKLAGPDGCETPEGYTNCTRGIYPDGSCNGNPAP